MHVLFILMLIGLTSLPSFAADACRRSGAEVICTSEGFDKLVDLCVTRGAAASTCKIQLQARIDEVADLTRALTTCQRALPLTPERPFWRPLGGITLVSVGAALIPLATLLDLPVEWRVGGVVGGLGLISSGYLLTVPLD